MSKIPKRRELLALVEQVPGAWVGMKMAALLLVMEGQRPSRIAEVLGLNRLQWDGPTLVTHLKRRFGIALKVRQAQILMHQLGYSMKRASHAVL